MRIAAFATFLAHCPGIVFLNDLISINTSAKSVN